MSNSSRRRLSREPFSNSGCYAAALCDCDTEVNVEHWFSKAGLQVLARGGRVVAVEGHHWQEKPYQIIGISRLGAHVLCTHHNTLLSPLDEEFGRFAAAAVDGLEMVRDGKGDEQAAHNFRGEGIERWMMKALLGAIRAGYSTEYHRSWTPPLFWLEYLFGDRELPSNCGLFSPEFAPSQTRFVPPRAMAVRVFAVPALMTPRALSPC